VAALELPPRGWERALANLRRRDVLLRISLALAAALTLCGVIRGWQPPFVYRTDYTLTRDLTARVPFQMADLVATAEAKNRARWQVKHIYVVDPEPLVRLRSTLRNRVSELMRAATYAELAKIDAKIWNEFQPPVEQGTPEPTQLQLEESFRKFHDALVGDQNLAAFEESVGKALASFEQRGLLQKLPSQGNQDEIIVYPAGRTPEAGEKVKVSDVQIAMAAAAIQDSLRKRFGSPDVADPVFQWLRPKLPDTLTHDDAATKQALDAAETGVKQVVVNYEKGQTVAEAGQPLRPDQIKLLRTEYEATMAQLTVLERLARAASTVVLVLGLFALCTPYLLMHERRLVISLKRLFMILALLIITVAVSVSLALWPTLDAWRLEIIPLLLFGQTVAIAYRQELALLLAAIVAMIIVLGIGAGVGGFLLLMGVTATAILQLQRIRSRTKLIYVGLSSSVMAMLLTVATGIIDGQPVGMVLLWEAFRNGVWTVTAGFLMTGLLPFIESLFGVLTDISLLELGDVAHPLLQELIRRAPSTYNHSITVGSIAEAAAEAIGARGLLVRVGAYFHDIGKMLKPGYFIENQSPNENRHDSLVPAMSTLVIIAHIKDGADLARQHNLPEPIIDFIEQHHGTTLVEYFYGRANQQRQQDPNSSEVDESSYRYPGPRPQTKESGVLMLADAVESASRSLVDPTPARIESLVREIAERKLDDSQFDESGLTLRELRTIEDSMIKSLTAIYHGRVKYPDQKTA
jgi:putative nucleotidyltransferase with HDIG domain